MQTEAFDIHPGCPQTGVQFGADREQADLFSELSQQITRKIAEFSFGAAPHRQHWPIPKRSSLERPDKTTKRFLVIEKRARTGSKRCPRPDIGPGFWSARTRLNSALVVARRTWRC
jgi:hypothetical protein